MNRARHASFICTLVVLFASCVPGAGARAADAGGVTLRHIDWPRSFGYRVGDTVPVRIALDIEPGWLPDRDGLPEPGQGDRQFELRRLDVTDARERCARCSDYTLEWQLMKSVRSPQTLRLAPVTLRFRKGSEVRSVAVPAFAIDAAPLLLWQSKKDWIDSVHPGYRASPFNVSAPLRRAGLWALAAVALLAAALWAGGRLGAQAARPFARAWRDVRALRRRTSGDAPALALRALHHACNGTAGCTVFSETLPAFLQQAPEFADLADDLAAAFAASRAHFFGLPPTGRFTTLAEIDALLRALRDRERLHARRAAAVAPRPAAPAR
jgi:mxaA protein